MAHQNPRRELNVVATGPYLAAPRSEQLPQILQQARCILWTGDVEGCNGWQKGHLPGTTQLRWSPRVVDEQAAQRVLPLEIKSGSNYFEAWRDSRHRDDNEQMWVTAFGALTSGDSSYHQVFRCYDSRGIEHRLFEIVNVQTLAPGHWHVVGVATDITSHLLPIEDLQRISGQLEASLGADQESSAVLDILLNSVPIGVALLARNGSYLRANREFCRLNGISELTVRGEPATRWIDSTLAALLAEVFTKVLDSGNPVTRQLTITTDQGSRFWNVSVTPVGLDLSHALAASLVVEDVTHAVLAQQLHLAKEIAEKANAAKDRFLAMLSHELRMPLTPVLAISTIYESDPTLPAELREHLGTIRRNIELEAQLIEDLLDVTRISRGTLSFNKGNCNFHEVIRFSLESCNANLCTRGLTLTTDLLADAHCLHGDNTRLRQLVLNLVGNAMKYTPAGGSITISTRNLGGPGGHCLELKVTDTGIGIAPDSLPRIFEPFEQAGELQANYRKTGLGLGLAICRHIVEVHGGTIEASSPGLNSGTTITVTLPGASSPITCPVQHPTRQKAPVKCSRILLVEDHADTARIMALAISRAGHTVTTAGSVQEALQHLTAGRFDLLISDLGLPDGSGCEIMSQFRGQFPGIALSGFGSDHDLQQTRAAGFAEHLVKPVAANALLTAIARHCSMNPGVRGAIPGRCSA